MGPGRIPGGAGIGIPGGPGGERFLEKLQRGESCLSRGAACHVPRGRGRRKAPGPRRFSAGSRRLSAMGFSPGSGSPCARRICCLGALPAAPSPARAACGRAPGGERNGMTWAAARHWSSTGPVRRRSRNRQAGYLARAQRAARAWRRRRSGLRATGSAAAARRCEWIRDSTKTWRQEYGRNEGSGEWSGFRGSPGTA